MSLEPIRTDFRREVSNHGHGREELVIGRHGFPNQIYDNGASQIANVIAESLSRD